MSEVVFCYEENAGRYGWFFHEADVRLLSLANTVDSEAMTAEEARKAWEPYREFWPEIYDEEEYGKFEFPDSDTVVDTLPTSSSFWRTAARLDIPGVGFSEDVSPVSGEIFEVRGDDVLGTLKDQLRGNYRVVVMDDVVGYAGDWSPEEARERIERARVEQVDG